MLRQTDLLFKVFLIFFLNKCPCLKVKASKLRVLSALVLCCFSPGAGAAFWSLRTASSSRILVVFPSSVVTQVINDNYMGYVDLGGGQVNCDRLPRYSSFAAVPHLEKEIVPSCPWPLRPQKYIAGSSKGCKCTWGWEPAALEVEFLDYLTILLFLSEVEADCLVWLHTCHILSRCDLHTRQDLNLFCQSSTSEVVGSGRARLRCSSWWPCDSSGRSKVAFLTWGWIKRVGVLAAQKSFCVCCSENWWSRGCLEWFAV